MHPRTKMSPRVAEQARKGLDPLFSHQGYISSLELKCYSVLRAFIGV